METLEIRRGDTLLLAFEYSNPDGTPVDVTGLTLGLALVKRNSIESYENPIIKLTTPSGLTVTMTEDVTEIAGEVTAEQTKDLASGTIYLLLRDETNQLTIGECMVRVS